MITAETPSSPRKSRKLFLSNLSGFYLRPLRLKVLGFDERISDLMDEITAGRQSSQELLFLGELGVSAVKCFGFS